MKPLDVFRFAKTHVPAYQAFLKKKGIGQVKDFSQVPVMEKKTYIEAYPLLDRTAQPLPPMIYASSGSSGKPTFWFGDDAHEERGGMDHEMIFRDIFRIKKQESTLVIICFAMGVWVAGHYTLGSCRAISRRGYNLTAITPGIEKEDVLSILHTLAPKFQNVVIAGYPPFLMNIFIEAKKRRITFSKNTFVLAAGDKFTESWRTHILLLLGKKDPNSVINIYGCADAGILGYETPLSIFIRQHLFAKAHDAPGLFQYNQKHIFFEQAHGEILFTIHTPVPLIRYNIHDIGEVMPFTEIEAFLKSEGLWKKAKQKKLLKWNGPFVRIRGRSDVAVTFYALKIPSSHLQAGTEKLSFLSGNFFAYTKDTHHHKRYTLHMNVELKPGIQGTKQMTKAVQKKIIQQLLEVNIEFRKLFSTLGPKALPIVVLQNNGEELIPASHRQGLLAKRGKKPKMIIQ